MSRQENRHQRTPKSGATTKKVSAAVASRGSDPTDSDEIVISHRGAHSFGAVGGGSGTQLVGAQGAAYPTYGGFSPAEPRPQISKASSTKGPIRPARMIDVARLAGVATMTVSRVLSGSVPVSAETSKRVLEAVERLGYRPNEIARSLREQRSRQIGIIVPNLYDPFFGICVHAISLVARKHQYSVITALSQEDPGIELEEATRLLRRNIDGLVIIPASGKTRLLGQEFSSTPIVALDRPITGSSFDNVLVENRGGAKEAVDHLIGHGHKRIAYIGLSSGSYTMRRRLAGYRAALSGAGLQPMEFLLGETQDETLEAVRQLTSGSKPATALFCANNLLMRNVLHALATLNVSIPDQMAILGFDDFDTAEIMKPAVTVVRQDPAEMGKMAAEMLVARLAGRNSAPEPPNLVTLPVELIIRESCGGHKSKAGSN